MREAKNYFAWQASLIKPHLGQRVVEVGCGAGNFTNFLLDRELVIALDPDAEALAAHRERFGARPNLRLIRGGAADVRALDRFSPDSAVYLNVLEHVADDAEAIRAMASILPRGATIVLWVPALPALYGPIDRNLGHYRRYRKADLYALARAASLTIVRLHYANLAGALGWWVNARVFKLQEQSPAQIRFFDRYIVPPMAVLERIAAPPLGQSLFAVLEKP